MNSQVHDQFHIYPYRRVTSPEPPCKEQKKFFAGKFKDLGIARLLSPFKWFTLEGLFFFGSCFILTKAHILGGISPFGLAFFAAASSSYPGYFWLLLATNLLGQVMFYPPFDFMLNATVIGLYVIWQLIFPPKFIRRWAILPLTVFIISITVKIGWLILSTFALHKMLEIIVEAFLASGLVLVFISCLNILQGKKIPEGLSIEESVCGVIFCLSLTAGIIDIQIANLQVGNIVSRYLIMLVAWIGGAGAGASLGAVLGILPSLIQINAPILVGVYSFSGLLAGVFSQWNKIGVSLGFVLGNLILSIYFLDRLTISHVLIETGIAIFFILITPNILALRFRSVPGWKSTLPIADDYGRYADFFKLSINIIGRTFSDLASALVQNAPTKEEVEEERIQDLFQAVAKTVCEGCSLFSLCWEQDFYDTYKNILAAFVVIEKNGLVKPENLPSKLSRRCTRSRELAIMFNCLYETYRLDNYWRQKVAEGQDLLVTQLKGTSEVLMDIALKMQADGYFHEELELSIATNLTHAGFNYENVQVWKTAGTGDMEIHLTLSSCPGEEPCVTTIMPLLSDLVGEPLILEKRNCGSLAGDIKCELRLMPLPALRVETGFAQEAKNQRQICGDSCGMFQLGNRNYVLILSDGMGVGIKAARESEAVVFLLERFLRAGFKPSMAVHMLNSLLLFRSEEETFATIDLATIDLYTGETEFLKIGSAPSYIIRGEDILPVHNKALPVGIIKDIMVEPSKEILQNGDILIMITDGLLEVDKQEADQETKFLEILQSTKYLSPEVMAGEILYQVKLNVAERRNDDLSVLVAKIQWEVA